MCVVKVRKSHRTVERELKQLKKQIEKVIAQLKKEAANDALDAERLPTGLGLTFRWQGRREVRMSVIRLIERELKL